MITFGGRQVGTGLPAIVIAEMAWAHDGTRENALTIAQAAVKAGADVLNIHLTSMPDYMVRNYGAGPGRVSAGKESQAVYDYLTQISLADGDWRAVAAYIHQNELALSCMANDVASLDLADQLGADIYAVPPACMVEQRYMEAVAERQASVLLGIGGAELGEIERSLDLLARRGAGQVMLQYGIQNYPTDPELLNLRYLRTIREVFGLPIAYHDHTEAGTALATQIPMAALALGVDAVEKHMTHDRSAKGEDHESALNPSELVEFVKDLRVVEASLGQASWRPLSEAEQDYRRVVRKRAVARTSLPAGTLVTHDCVTFKRSDAGLYPEEFERILGRRTRVPLEADRPIDAEVVD